MITNQEFTEIILNTKTLYFSEETLSEPENYPIKLVMTSAGIRWFIIDFEKYPLANLQDALKDKFYSSSYETWEDSLIYLKNIVSYFSQERKGLDYNTSKLLKNQLSVSVLKDFIGSDTSFLEKYLLESNDDEIDCIFLNGLISISFEADFSINLIIQLFKKVIDLQLDSSSFRIDWHTIIFGLAANYPNKGKKIIQSLKGDLTTRYEELIGQTIGGVCSTSLIENIAFFKELYLIDKLQGWIIWGMTRIEKALSEENLIKILDLAETNSQKVDVSCQLMRFYIIIWGYNSNNKKVSLRCFEGIKYLLTQENPTVLYSFLDNTTNNSTLPEESVFELLKVFLQNPNHPVEVFSAKSSNINAFDWCVKENIKTPKYFFEILLSFVNDTSHQFKIDVFNESLPEMLERHPEDSVRFILNCLIDYKGNVRHLGHTLLEQIVQLNPEIRFGKELKELTFEQQNILILSIAIPQTLIFSKLFCFIVPLLSITDDETILSLVIKVLLKNAINIEGLTDVVRVELEDSDLKKEILTVLDSIDEKHQENFTKKIALKEFNPEYSQRKNFEYYQKVFHEKLNKQFQEMWESMPLNKAFGNNIVLLKGGGFKSEHNDTFSPLSNIQNSISIPFSAFLDSERQSFDTNYYFNTNWENSNDWQKWWRKF